LPIFLFQPDPIDEVEFKPITIDSHIGVIKIIDGEIYYDFQLNNSESIIVGTDREKVLARIQRGFEYLYNAYGRIDYDTMQAWKRLQKYIKIKTYLMNIL
jgi:hypothetical protein